MSDLLARIRKSRESMVEVDGYRLTVRRPTDWQALQMHQDESTVFDVAREYVVDWSGVKESDLLKSGGSDEIAFDADLWAEWLSDNDQFILPIYSAVMESYTAHRNKKETASKN